MPDELGIKKPSDAVKIITNRVLRNEGIERRIIEDNRTRYMYVMLATGGCLLLLALLW